MQSDNATAVSRRDLLALIGSVAGSAAMYQAMSSLGLAADSDLQGPDQRWTAMSEAPRC